MTDVLASPETATPETASGGFFGSADDQALRLQCMADLSAEIVDTRTNLMADTMSFLEMQAETGQQQDGYHREHEKVARAVDSAIDNQSAEHGNQAPRTLVRDQVEKDPHIEALHVTLSEVGKAMIRERRRLRDRRAQLRQHITSFAAHISEEFRGRTDQSDVCLGESSYGMYEGYVVDSTAKVVFGSTEHLFRHMKVSNGGNMPRPDQVGLGSSFRLAQPDDVVGLLNTLDSLQRPA
jgi:hypothetical protein